MGRLAGGVTAAVVAALGCAQSAAAFEVFTFTDPGLATFIVPDDFSSARFELIGGQGGAGSNDDSESPALGGWGGRTTASLPLDDGDEYDIMVAAEGEDGSELVGGLGGLPGGGNGGTFCTLVCFSGGGGGGATIVADGSFTNPANWRLVAGGGGGGPAISLDEGSAVIGGDGGGFLGERGDGVEQNPLCGGEGGNQSGSVGSGLQLEGGDAPSGDEETGGGGGGGGGGYFGGEGAIVPCGGGGGSGFIHPSATDSSFPAPEDGGPDGFVGVIAAGLNVDVEGEEGLGTVTGDGINVNGTPDADPFEFYAPDAVVELTAAPAADAVFAGFSENCEPTGPTTCEVEMEDDLQVEAFFEPKPRYPLTVELEGEGSGLVTSQPAGIECGNGDPAPTDCFTDYQEGTSVTLTAAATADSEFAGFSGGGCSGTATTCTVTMDQERHVTATFTVKPLALTVGKSGDGHGLVTSEPAGIECGADCTEGYQPGAEVTLTAIAFANSSFAGFTGAGCSTSPCTVTMDAAKSVEARFDEIPERLLLVGTTGEGSGTVTSAPEGIACGDDCAEAYADGTEVTLTADPDDGSDFAGFTGAGCSTSPCTVTMDAAKSVQARFNPIPSTDRELTVSRSGGGLGTVTSDPEGIACGDDCAEIYPGDSMVTLTATPAEGSEFAGFTGAGCSTSPCTVTMDVARHVDARFTPIPDHVLFVTMSGEGSGAVASEPGGIACGVDCVEAYAEGTTVTLTASPAPRSDFLGFTGAGCSTSPCIVTLEAATSVDAEFAPISKPPRCKGKPATIVGTAHSDRLRGTPRADVIVGLGGADRIKALGGSDRICGTRGDDDLNGGEGPDRVDGGAGRDKLVGAGGFDRCWGGPGRDSASACQRAWSLH